MRSHKRRARGMTMIEVMMALLIATVASVGTLAMIGTLVGGAAQSRSAMEASVLVQSRIEAIATMGGVSITPIVPANGVVTEANLDAFGVANGGPYTRLSNWSVTPDGRRRHVDVTVQWTDGLGRLHAVTAPTERIP